jgi:hypothetical protein
LYHRAHHVGHAGDVDDATQAGCKQRLVHSRRH